MVGKHANPVLGWHCPAGLRAWVEDEADRRSVTLSVILTEALSEYRSLRTPPEDRAGPDASQ
jgi:hypothetical protein